jgi:glutathione peroxidase
MYIFLSNKEDSSSFAFPCYFIVYVRFFVLVSFGSSSGFVVLAFPCNQFLSQEPGTSEEAHQFACTRFKAEYPVFQKVRVNGQNAAPVYKFLKSKKPSFLGSRIKWNFTKFLVGKDGQVIDRYGTTVSPLSIQKDIEKALAQEL